MSKSDGRLAKGVKTREAMLDAAAELLAVHGYTGTGINEILSKSRAPKGSLYYHFPGGKREIAARAVERAGSRLTVEMEAAFDSAQTTSQGARDVITFLADRFEASGFTHGCPIAPVTLDCDDDEVQQACRAIFDQWIGLVASRLVADGHSRADSDRHAELVVAVIEGALVLARAARNRKPLDRLVSQLDLVLPRDA